MERPGLLEAPRSLLVVIDLQGKLLEMTERWRRTVAVTGRLLRMAALFERPVVLTEQYPRGLGPTHPEIRAAFDALEVPKRFVEKVSFGCCGDAGFIEALDALLPDVPPARRQYVVVGIEAHVCVMQTAIELLRGGGEVHVCWDAVGGRGEEYVRQALRRMVRAGAQITNHESVGFEWARSKDHRAFREMSALLRAGQPD